MEYLTGFCSRCKMLSSVQACTENQILLFQYFDVCGFGCVKKVNPLCIKFDISSCFAYKMKKYHLLKRFSTNFHIFLFLKTVNQTHSYYLPPCFMSSYGVVFFCKLCGMWLTSLVNERAVRAWCEKCQGLAEISLLFFFLFICIICITYIYIATIQ